MRKAKKGLYILPSLFTVASIFCGVLAIVLMFRAQVAEDVYKAALLIGLGMVLDSFDGRVARLTNTQSEFGVQLDSLADVITFGVAPAIILYEFALQSLGFVGVFAAFCFTACGALRLARFNVQAASETGPSTDFIGMPIPGAAGVAMSFVLLLTSAGYLHAPESMVIPAAVLSIGLGALMVSTVRYKTFKKARSNPREKAFLSVMLLLFVGLTAGWGFPVGLATCLFVYTAIGLLGAAYQLGLRGVRAVRSGSGAVVTSTVDDDDELELRLTAPDDERERD